MATVKGVFGQSNPAAATLTPLYTVPALKSFTGRVIITNRSGATSFRVSIAVNGAGDSLEQYIAYDKDIALRDTGSTVAFVAGSGDIIRVFATLATISFTATGIEQDD